MSRNLRLVIDEYGIMGACVGMADYYQPDYQPPPARYPASHMFDTVYRVCFRGALRE